MKAGSIESFVVKNTLSRYKSKIYKDHKSNTIRQWYGMYAYFWFHTQIWLEPIDRRPYTYIMRDWIYPRIKLFYAISIIWFSSMIILSLDKGLLATIITLLTSLLWSHLVWGSQWHEGEQEWPTIIDC